MQAEQRNPTLMEEVDVVDLASLWRGALSEISH
jgi:hypothetical protein